MTFLVFFFFFGLPSGLAGIVLGEEFLYLPPPSFFSSPPAG